MEARTRRLAMRAPRSKLGAAAMEILSDRLLLRDFTDDDEPPFLAYHADPLSAEFYGPEEARPEHMRELLRTFIQWAAERPRRNYQLAIVERREPRALVGSCGLRDAGIGAGVGEFGIELGPRWWGNGYAGEAALRLLEVGFRELGLHQVRAVSVDANVRAARLMRRLGFATAGARPGPAWMRARGWCETEWQLTLDRWKSSALDLPER